jgi:hypothetical protein
MNVPLEMGRAEWHALRRAARDLDVARGGYWRAYRDGRIAFFCGLDNFPAGLRPSLRKGPWPAPRYLVGMAVASPLSGGWVLVRLDPWDEPATESTRVWLARQFERLRDHAEGGFLRRVAQTT